MKRIATTLFVTALLALLAVPLAAFPPQCDETCSCWSKCSQICAIGNHVSNCGALGDCQGGVSCFAAQSAPTSANSPKQLLDNLFAPTEPVSSASQPECTPAL